MRMLFFKFLYQDPGQIVPLISVSLLFIQIEECGRIKAE